MTRETLPADVTDQWLTLRGQARVDIAPKGDANDNRVLQKFAVAVEAQEEGPARTPMVIAGQVQPLDEPTGFVLVAAGDEWAPALDLAGPKATPWPVMAATGGSGGFSVQPSATGTTVPSPAPRQADRPIGLALLALVFVGFAIYYHWRTRHLVD